MSHATTAAAATQGRSVRFVPDPDGQGDRIIITQKGKETSYWIEPLNHPEGLPAYRLEKQGDGSAENDVYDVVLNQNMSECTCADFTYRGWVKGACKHILACHVLREHGKLS